MSKFITLYIYAIISLFSIVYDAFLSKDVNYIIYFKNNTGMNVLSFLGTIFWGLLIFLANYYEFNILSLVLLAISVISIISILICDQLEIELYIEEMYGFSSSSQD
jgi:hypothetical protein